MTLPTVYGRNLALGALLAGITLIAGCANPKPAMARTAPPEIKMSAESAKSPFASYDREVVSAIQARWYELLDEQARKLKRDRQGLVVVQFVLMSDGRITSLKTVRSNVDEVRTLLCQKAILDPSPFKRWPDEMARMANAAHREIKFTFYYE